jgi:hypothetical protein
MTNRERMLATIQGQRSDQIPWAPMNDTAFELYLDDVFESLGTGERLIFGVSDNVPPDATSLDLRASKRV